MINMVNLILTLTGCWHYSYGVRKCVRRTTIM